MEIKRKCPSCGLESDEVRCPRCNTLKVISCSGACLTCKASASCGVVQPFERPDIRARTDPKRRSS